MRKYINIMVPLLRAEPQVSSLEVLVPDQSLSCVDSIVKAQSWTDGPGSNEVKGAIRALRPDVVFIPTARWIDCGDIPVVTMVRNMEPLVAPFTGNSPYDSLKNLARRGGARLACRRSQRIIAVSKMVRSFLVEQWHTSPDRIGVVHHGVEDPLAGDAARKPQGWPDDRPVLFAAGSIRPMRGIEDAISAVSGASDVSRELALCIAGEPHPSSRRYDARLHSMVRDLELQDRVIWLGQLGLSEMAWGFQNCVALLMTTRVEACPNVALEAMSYGCTIVSTDSPPMPEIFCDAARFYPAGRPTVLAEEIAQVVNMPPSEREPMRRAALTRAKDFDWRTTASRTATELARAINGK
jgi:glycosyltransferase involved in cell wall biosynthesis